MIRSFSQTNGLSRTDVKSVKGHSSNATNTATRNPAFVSRHQVVQALTSYYLLTTSFSPVCGRFVGTGRYQRATPDGPAQGLGTSLPPYPGDSLPSSPNLWRRRGCLG